MVSANPAQPRLSLSPCLASHDAAFSIIPKTSCFDPSSDLDSLRATMAYHPEYPICTICGIRLEEPLCYLEELAERSPDERDWKSDVVALSGPHWSPGESPSLDLADDAVHRFDAVATWHPSVGLVLLPDKRSVDTQSRYESDKPNTLVPPASMQLFMGIHAACEEVANRVMRTSFNARVRSIGYLWMTLERRCARPMDRHPHMNFLPYLPESQSGQPRSFGTGRYFVPYSCIIRYGDEWDGWVTLNPPPPGFLGVPATNRL